MGNALGIPEDLGDDAMGKFLALGERLLPTPKPSTVTVPGLGSSSSSPAVSLLGSLANLVPDELAAEMAQLPLAGSLKRRRS